MTQITLSGPEVGALLLQNRWLSAAIEEIDAAAQAGDYRLAGAIASVARNDGCAEADRQAAREAVDRSLPVLTGGRCLSQDQAREALRAAGRNLLTQGGARG